MKQGKMKIIFGLVVRAKVGEMDEKTREGGSIRMMKEVVGCAQTVVGKKKFCIQFKDDKYKYMSTGQLMMVLGEEEVDKVGDKSISNIPKKEKVACRFLVGILLLIKVVWIGILLLF